MYFPKVLKPRPILFDLGDTLLNFSATNPVPYFKEGAKLAHDFMAERGLKPPPFKKYLNASRRCYLWALIRAALRRREVDLHGALCRLFHSFSLPSDDDFVLMVAGRFYEPMKRLGTAEEGVHAVLDALLENEHPMGIVSNTMIPGPLLDQQLEEEGLLKYFPVRVYSSDVGVRKPHPEIFLAAMRALNIKPQHTIFIGDKPDLDVKGAKRLGMTTVLKVRKGMPPRSRHQPDHIIKHLTELPKLLQQISPRCYERPPLLPRKELPMPQFGRRA